MGRGNIRFNIYCDTVGQPVNSAKIRISGGGGKDITLTTNDSGLSDVVQLDCPSVSYSLQPQYKVRPYEPYTITVSKQGLEDITVEGIELFDTISSTEDIVMFSDEEEKTQRDYYNIPDHMLWGNYDPKIIVNPFTQTVPGLREEDQNSDVMALVEPVVPEYIIVHDGLPTNMDAPNYYVSFPDYIKNVATSEIYSTWPEETLKANIYAIISFTLNRYYSEWYRSKGYPFTITTSTQFDQKYIKNRNIAQPIANVVDSIFDQYIQFGNLPQPFFSQYNDGVKTNNRGWLSQWGSKDLGDKGVKALEILKTYYGNTVSIVKAPSVEGMPISFPGYNLTPGICGDAVQKVQLELNIIAGSYPAIPKILPANGIYATKTEAAVRKFQDIFNLPVSGIIDFSTWYKISYVYISVSKMLRGRYDM